MISIWLLLQLVFSIFTVFATDCRSQSDCKFANGFCQDSKCVSSAEFILSINESSSLEIPDRWGGSCQENQQCISVLKIGGICKNGICSCSDNYHYFRGQCWKTSGLGESCLKNENCYVDYDFEAAVCQSSKCQCSSGYYMREYSSCRPISKKPGDPCVITLDCQYDGAICRNNHTCGKKSEKDDSIWSIETKNENLNFNTDLGICSKNKDCVPNAHCLRGHCTCNFGYFVANSTCFPEIGTACSSKDDCVGKFMVCDLRKKKCSCEVGFVAEDGNRNCTKLAVQIGWSCLEDRWCTIFGRGGICVNKSCQCTNETHYVSEEMYCWTSRDVGDKCRKNYDCGDTDVVEGCVEGKCQCNNGYHSSSTNKTCHADSRKVGEPCFESLDCMFPNSTCDASTGKCSCAHGYMNKNDNCMAGGGGKCNSDGDCHAAGTSCIDSVCSCQKNYIINSNYSICLPVANGYLSTCEESQQCIQLLGNGSVCTDGQCKCMQGFKVSGLHCYEEAPLYSNCTNNLECQVKIHYSECQNYICQCKHWHPPDPLNRTCSGTTSIFSGNCVLFLMTILIKRIF